MYVYIENFKEQSLQQTKNFVLYPKAQYKYILSGLSENRKTALCSTNLKVQLQIKKDLGTALKLKLYDLCNTSFKTTEIHNEGIHEKVPQGEWQLQFITTPN